MSFILIRVALMALLIVALPSWASDTLPTSENPAKGNWNKMRPTSFAPTIQSAREQCDRTAKLDPNDRLTPASCELLEKQLKAGECRKVLVKDGVVHDFMNGREGGHSFVTKNVEKKLGRLDPALLCDLGDRTFVYWYIGKKDESCNNIGVVFTAKPQVAAPTQVPGMCGSNAKRYSHLDTGWPAQGNFCASGEQSSLSILFPQLGGSTRWSCLDKAGGQSIDCEALRDAAPRAEPKEPVCKWVSQRYIVPQSGQFIHVPGLSVAVCRGQVPIPDIFVNIPADVMTVTRQVKVCSQPSN